VSRVRDAVEWVGVFAALVLGSWVVAVWILGPA